MFKLTPVCSPLNSVKIFQLIQAQRLFLVTFDDSILLYSLIALIRGMAGKSTAALFLRPQKGFDELRLKYRLKKLIFMLIKLIPRLSIITITSFSLAPHYAAVAHHGVFDPQYWDKHDGKKLQSPTPSKFSEDILRRAGGRRILTFPGLLTQEKGFGFFVDILRQHPKILDRILFVAAGLTVPATAEGVEDFVSIGGYLVNRMLDDAESESVYSASDIIWACYEPGYDQASGIFGRALQFGVPVIVRQDSLIHKTSIGLQSPVLGLEFGNSSAGFNLLINDTSARLNEQGLDDLGRQIASWRGDFISRGETALAQTDHAAR